MLQDTVSLGAGLGHQSARGKPGTRLRHQDAHRTEDPAQEPERLGAGLGHPGPDWGTCALRAPEEGGYKGAAAWPQARATGGPGQRLCSSVLPPPSPPTVRVVPGTGLPRGPPARASPTQRSSPASRRRLRPGPRRPGQSQRISPCQPIARRAGARDGSNANVSQSRALHLKLSANEETAAGRGRKGRAGAREGQEERAGLGLRGGEGQARLGREGSCLRSRSVLGRVSIPQGVASEEGFHLLVSFW